MSAIPLSVAFPFWSSAPSARRMVSRWPGELVAATVRNTFPLLLWVNQWTRSVILMKDCGRTTPGSSRNQSREQDHGLGQLSDLSWRGELGGSGSCQPRCWRHGQMGHLDRTMRTGHRTREGNIPEQLSGRRIIVFSAPPLKSCEQPLAWSTHTRRMSWGSVDFGSQLMISQPAAGVMSLRESGDSAF